MVLIVWLQCQTCPTGLLFSPDGKLMATLAKDRKVRYCDMFTLDLQIKCWMPLKPFACVWCMQWSGGRLSRSPVLYFSGPVSVTLCKLWTSYVVFNLASYPQQCGKWILTCLGWTVGQRRQLAAWDGCKSAWHSICMLTWAMNGNIVHYQTASSCKSAKIVKLCWSHGHSFK